MDFTLKVWKQNGPQGPGKFETIPAKDIPTEASFLEMLDIVNNHLEAEGKEPIAFDSDCREGICGTCGIVVNGKAHGSKGAVASCQLYMRDFKPNETITLEPWRAKAFPIVKDLIVDRSAFDRIMMAGGYISIRTGAAQDANALPIPKENAELAMDAAACIGCGACVATCKNASAMLFTSAKVSQFALLPQGQPERNMRVINMVQAMDKEGFGGCTNEGECQAACPKEINLSNIARLNREYLWARIFG